ncbi:hypothetical protein [Erythrobacter phage vB_EliS-L02]|nr:hypothetical protein [Erythrobacter phage vB_EliS-L02]
MTKRLFDDGVHYVRRASSNDRHPMRFVVCAHVKAKSSRTRHCPSEEEAIEVAKRFTELAIAENKTDAKLAEAKNPPPEPPPPPKEPAIPDDVLLRQMSDEEFERRTRVEPKERKRDWPPNFATTHFTCKLANPAAQVWECTSLPGEKSAPGRRRKGRRAPNESIFNHTKGQCAVLLGRTPVREADGHIRVFRNWVEADEYAYSVFEEAWKEGEVIDWKPGNVVVDRLTDVEICFDPSDSAIKPFYLMIRKGDYQKPYYQPSRPRNYVTNAKNADGTPYQPQGADERAAHDFNRKLERMFNEEFRSGGLTNVIARFKTIWEAEAQALELERTYCGNEHLYPYGEYHG